MPCSTISKNWRRASASEVPGGSARDRIALATEQLLAGVRAYLPEDADMPLSDWMDPDDFNPGYLMRAVHLLPRRGDKPEWQHTQDDWTEKDTIPAIDLDGGEFVYA